MVLSAAVNNPMRDGLRRSGLRAGCVSIRFTLCNMGHECYKKLTLAFRKPAVATTRRRPARADGPKVELF